MFICKPTVGSLLDSVAKIPDIVNFAKENNQIAIALTDHGKMSGFVDLQKLYLL